MSKDPNIGKVFSNGLTNIHITGTKGTKYTARQTGFLEKGVESLCIEIDRELIKQLKEQGE